MITAFMEGGLSTDTVFFKNFVTVDKTDTDGSSWSWMSRKETTAPVAPHSSADTTLQNEKQTRTRPNTNNNNKHNPVL